MDFYIKSYVRAFQKYAQGHLNKISLVKRITRYALILNYKAHQLLRRASLNKLVDLPKLQKELFEMGRDYIKKFAAALKKETARKPEKTNET